VLTRLGLPENITTLFSTEDQPEQSTGDDTASENDGAAEGVVATTTLPAGVNDAHFRPMELPHKWQRLNLPVDALPVFQIDPRLPPSELATRARQAGTDLTAAVQLAVRAWADSDEGKLWCYRKGVVVRPSQYRSWAQFLDDVRKDPTRELALPDITLEWQVEVSPDWSNPERANLHVSLENASVEPRRGHDIADGSVFQVHLDVQMPKALHAPLKLGRVEASYRYNQYLD
jgi:hypothetical protein